MKIFMKTKRKRSTAAVLRVAIVFASSGDRREPLEAPWNPQLCLELHFGSLWATLGGALLDCPLKMHICLFVFHLRGGAKAPAMLPCEGQARKSQ